MLVVCDTAGSEDFSSLRPLSYPDADVFIICYSVDQIDSLRSIREKWIPEVRNYRVKQTFIICLIRCILILIESNALLNKCAP